MNTRLFLVDVESTGPSPANSVMTEFGVVDFETRAWFHGHLWDFVPTPNIPALPIATEQNAGWTAVLPANRGAEFFDGDRHNILRGEPLEMINGSEAFEVYEMFKYWLRLVGEESRPVFVSDNPGWDFMWMAYGFDLHGLTNPFGHSSRRIGDFAAGLAGNWKQQTKWKGMRDTRHTHNPVDDAMGNAEALEKLLKEAENG